MNKVSNLQRRHASEKRFRLCGAFAIGISILFLFIMLINIISKGSGGFMQTVIKIPIILNEEIIDPSGKREASTLKNASYGKIIRNSLSTLFPQVENKKKLYSLSNSDGTMIVRGYVLKNPTSIGKTVDMWLPVSSEVSLYYKTKKSEKLTEEQKQLVSALHSQDRIKRRFNLSFFSSGDSRDPEQAGILGSFVGSIFTVFICILSSLPLAVLTAVYLEEFAPRNRFTDFIEININNLAAVPSIIYGLLGLSLYLNFLGFPRSSSIAGGFTLALLILPIIIIATRASIKSVPQSIRQGAMAIGASPIQVALHHTIPLAMPGIMTGTILGLARAFGETAPLIMIGMVAFIADVPKSIFDPATVMPVQIYLWADSAELGFVEKTSAAILVLLAVLVTMNLVAVMIRNKYERRW